MRTFCAASEQMNHDMRAGPEPPITLTSAAGRYASTLYSIAKEENTLAAVEADISNVGAALSTNQDLLDYFKDPSVAPADKLKDIMAVAEDLKFAETTKKFFGESFSLAECIDFSVELIYSAPRCDG